MNASDSSPNATYALTLRRHTGLLVLMQRRRYTVKGTLAQCEAAYKKAQTHNFVFGWWGVLSMLIFNWIAIFGNVSAMGKLRQVANGRPT